MEAQRPAPVVGQRPHKVQVTQKDVGVDDEVQRQGVGLGLGLSRRHRHSVRLLQKKREKFPSSSSSFLIPRNITTSIARRTCKSMAPRLISCSDERTSLSVGSQSMASSSSGSGAASGFRSPLFEVSPLAKLPEMSRQHCHQLLKKGRKTVLVPSFGGSLSV